MLVQIDKKSETFTIDDRIMILQNRSVRWLWNAYNSVNKKEIVQKVSSPPTSSSWMLTDKYQAFELCTVREGLELVIRMFDEL